MRQVLVWLAGFGLWIATAAAITQEALILGFEIGPDSQPRLVSLSASPRAPDVRPINGPHWTILGKDDSQKVLWSRPLPIPRQFHGDPIAQIAFSVIVPRLAADSHLSLQDDAGHEFWRLDVDQATLDVADATRTKAEPERLIAKAATHALLDQPANHSLQKQIEAARAAREEVRSAPTPTDMPPHAIWDGHAGKLSAGTPLVSSVGSPRESSASDVVAHVVDENGKAPGVAFAAFIYEIDGSNRQDLQVAADGSLRLSLRTGVSYDLRLMPPPPLATTTIRFTYSGTALDDFVLERGWQLEMVLKDTMTGKIISPSGGSYTVYNNENEHFAVTVGQGRLLATISKSPGRTLSLDIRSLPAYPVQVAYPLGRVSGDRTMDVLLDPIENVLAHVVAESGAPAPREGLSAYCNSHNKEGEPEYGMQGVALDSNTIRFSAPSNRKYYCDVQLNASRLSRRFTNVSFDSRSPVTWTMPTTINVRFEVVDDAGKLYANAIYGYSRDPGLGTTSSCQKNPCDLSLPSGRPATVQFDFQRSDIPLITFGPETFANGDRRTIVARRQHRVSGRIVADQAGSSYPRVRALDANGRFVISTRTNWIGEYELPLEEGMYFFEIDTNHENGGRGEAYYRRPHRTSPIVVSTSQKLADIVLGAEQGEVRFSAISPCPSGDAMSDLHRLGYAHLTTSDGSRINRPLFPMTTTSTPIANGQCEDVYRLVLTPDTYSLAIAPLGWPTRAAMDVQVVANQITRISETYPAERRTLVWTPRFSSAQGKPLDGTRLTLFDETQAEYFLLPPSTGGRIEIPYAQGWSLEVQAPVAGRSVRRQFRFDGGPLPTEVILDEIPLQEAMEEGLIRLHGDGDRGRRFNILLLADGYAVGKESFTDTNGNGIWDGVIWYDLDGDDVYSSGDLIQIRGDAPSPALGTVPTSANEPFIDLNGDGHLSLDDEALFLEGARAFVRSLLGSDFWSEHRDAFNVYLLFTPSLQAGISIQTKTGNKVVKRDTRYGATLELDRGILDVDRNSAVADALSVLPEVDLVIVAVNTPIGAGRSNVVIAQPGIMVLAAGPSQISPNEMAPSHEMGHFVGALCDEYEEFGGVHPAAGLATSTCPNVSYLPGPTTAPWLAWLPAGFDTPSRDIDGSVGMFEGASYYPGGAYRPSYQSTMRNTTPFFNAPSRAALLKAVQQRMGVSTAERRKLPPILPKRPD